VQHRPPTGRYRGRRRVVTPPRGRYAAVVTTTVVGAGVVALGAGAGFIPNAKQGNETVYEFDASTYDSRAVDAERANRDSRNGLTTSIGQTRPNVWLLPVHDYNFSSPFGQRWGRLHAGVDLALPHGTPYYAAHAGVVTRSSWYGGYGYAVVIDHGNGIETIYAHSSKLIAREGQRVEAGTLLGLVGNTGHSFGDHLHFEVHINGEPTDPVTFMRAHGCDIPRQFEAIYS
jgi:murein DD-endopeptidase MepM/ murein hydrolase activator NlpD